MMANFTPETVQRLVTTVYLFLGYMAFGMAASLSSPALIQISSLVQSPFETVSYGLSLRFVCYGIGGVLIGWIMKHADRQLTITACLLVSATSILLVPFARSVVVYILTEGIFGLSTGGINCAFNAWILKVWTTNPGPLMQGLHVFYSIGMIIAPAIEAPFLAQVNDSVSSAGNSTLITGETDLHKGSIADGSRILVPFTMGACAMFATAAFALLLRFKYPSDSVANSSSHQEIAGNSDEYPVRLKRQIMLMAMILFMAQQMVDTTITSFIPTYTVYSNLNFSEESAAHVSSVLAISMTVFRIFGCIIAAKVSNDRILYSSVCLIVLSNLLLLAWTSMTVTGVWATIAVMGAGNSVANACLYSFLSQRMEVTAFVCGCCMLMGCVGNVLSPLVVGHYLQLFPSVFPIVNLSGMSLLVLVLGVFVVLDRRHKQEFT